MSYPRKEVNSGFDTILYEEMTPSEYEKELAFYRTKINRDSNSTSRLERAYGSYLATWFSNRPCDGFDSYEVRYRLHKLPMSENAYMFE